MVLPNHSPLTASASIQGTKAQALAHHPDEHWLVTAFVSAMAPAPPGFRRTSHDYPAVRDKQRPVRAPLPVRPFGRSHRDPSGSSYLRHAQTRQHAQGYRCPWCRSTTSVAAVLPALSFDIALMVMLVEGVIPRGVVAGRAVPREPGHAACIHRHRASVLPKSRSPDRWLMTPARSALGEANLEALPYYRTTAVPDLVPSP